MIYKISDWKYNVKLTKCWIQNIEYNWQNIPAGEQWGDMPSALGTFDILFFSLTILSSWWWWWWWFWVLFLKYIYCFTFTLHLPFYFHFLNFTRHIQYLHYLYFHFYFLSFNPNEFLLSLLLSICCLTFTFCISLSWFWRSGPSSIFHHSILCSLTQGWW